MRYRDASLQFGKDTGLLSWECPQCGGKECAPIPSKVIAPKDKGAPSLPDFFAELDAYKAALGKYMSKPGKLWSDEAPPERPQPDPAITAPLKAAYGRITKGHTCPVMD